jgi:hypothetical protein
MRRGRSERERTQGRRRGARVRPDALPRGLNVASDRPNDRTWMSGRAAANLRMVKRRGLLRHQKAGITRLSASPFGPPSPKHPAFNAAIWPR